MVSASKISIDPRVMLGKPVIHGTRITVEFVLRKLSEGATEADLLDAYPHLTSDDIHAALAYAADPLADESRGHALVGQVAEQLAVLAAALDGSEPQGDAPATSSPAAGRSEVIERIRTAATDLERRLGVASLALFGSAGRDELGPGSDIDILVDFTGGADLDRYFGVKFRLEDLLGRPVDLATGSMLRPRLRESIAEDLFYVT